MGLDPNTADMHTEMIEEGGDMISVVIGGKGDPGKRNYGTPIWSVGALLEIIWKNMPSVMLIPGSRFDIEQQYWCTTDNDEISYDTDYYPTAIDALCDMVYWLLQNGYIKP